MEVVSRGTIGPDGKLRWYRTYKDKLVRAKDPEAQKMLTKRTKALDVDVLAVQEVENLVPTYGAGCLERLPGGRPDLNPATAWTTRRRPFVPPVTTVDFML